MGLYGERIGALRAVCSDAEPIQAIQRQLFRIAVAVWSAPAQNETSIVAENLRDEELESHWMQEVTLTGKRVIEIRNRLCDLLKVSETESKISIMIRCISSMLF
jgi:aromatic-amino-acid transaminase